MCLRSVTGKSDWAQFQKEDCSTFYITTNCALFPPFGQRCTLFLTLTFPEVLNSNGGCLIIGVQPEEECNLERKSHSPFVSTDAFGCTVEEGSCLLLCGASQTGRVRKVNDFYI